MGKYDFMIFNKPINRTAKKVLAKGFEFKSDKKPNSFYSETPLKCKNFKGSSKDNLTGQIFGKFTVIGFLGKRRADRPGLWLVKCVCGNYETRRSNSLKKNNTLNNQCYLCREIYYMKVQK